jgi:hypothetical protein
VRSELRRVPRGASVAIHLSGHGLPTADCGGYACGEDAYHAHARALFERTKRALEKAIRRPGRTGVFHLYGDGATDTDHPEEKVDSPIEALAARQAAGYRYVIDVPYEFDSDSRDTLIVLRRGYERPIPDWDRHYVSRFEHGDSRRASRGPADARPMAAAPLRAPQPDRHVRRGVQPSTT